MATPHTPGYSYQANGYTYPVGSTQTDYSPPPAPADNGGVVNNINVNNNNMVTNNNNLNNNNSMGYQASPTTPTATPAAPHPVTLVRAVDIMDPGKGISNDRIEIVIAL